MSAVDFFHLECQQLRKLIASPDVFFPRSAETPLTLSLFDIKQVKATHLL